MDSCAGNPINIGTGNKYQLETDYQGAGDFPLSFERTYNSDVSTLSERLGYSSGWRHSYERSIIGTGNSSLVVAYRPDGRAYTFTLVGGHWLPVADVNLQLNRSASPDVWQLTTEDDSIETYTADGKLQSIKSRGGATHTLSYTNGVLTTITHSSGRRLTLSYDGASRLSSLQDPAGNLYLYSYNATTGALETVTYPDSTPAVLTDNPVKTYVYNETANTAGANLPHALTGIVDENNQRFATFQYDSQRRAITTQHAGGAEFVGVSYGTDSNVVTDALGTPRTHRFQIVQGVVKSAGSDQPAGAGCSAAASNVSYDANGNIASRTDFNGNLSCYAYDLSRNLETVRLEGLAPGSSCPADLAAYTPAANGSERKITTQWHANYRLPTQIDQAGQRQSFGYDNTGNLLQKTVTDTATQQSRSWGYTYNSLGQVLTEDGPRTDVNDLTTYGYYADASADHKPGDLWKITNALGHVTTFTTYDANGRLLSLTDPNGLVVGFAYDARGRLTQKTVDGNATRYDYDPAGNLIKVTRPSGVYYRYTYDAAHRLTDITDALGGNIHYALDAMGNRIMEDIKDAQGNLVKIHRRSYDVLNRLVQDIGAYNQTTSYQYDANGNRTKITDANGHTTQHAYDSLDRLIRSTDALAGLTDYFYDAQDHLTQVTDPSNHSTVYSYNGFGELTQRNSPNTGITQYGYDNAGNLLNKLDANNKASNYIYDALNRLTIADYFGFPVVRIVNTYDGNPDGPAHQKGRLTAAQRDSQISSFTYDLRGNLISATGSALPRPGLDNTINYNYNAADQLTGIAFSTYRDLQYLYDAAGRVSRISVHDYDNGVFSVSGYNVTRILADNITHLPFGPVKNLSYGNGWRLDRFYDQDYRLTGQIAGDFLNLAYFYDPAGNLQSIYEPQAYNQNYNYTSNYNYDPLDRLISAGLGPNNLHYGYDEVGNRVLEDKNNALTQFGYDFGSQKLLSQTGARPDTIVTDEAGNITLSGGKNYSYAPDQRLVAVKQGNSVIAAYNYNTLGQRISKTTAAGTTNFDYDPQGRLLNENGNSLSANYVYLDGEPLARIDYNLNDLSGNVANWDIAYFHNNHIGAPIVTTDRLRQISWLAQMDPFGKVLPINPNIAQNLRFPGQYYDQETGLHYNMERYYDPDTGRYRQSDPIGLAGGINTYTYVGNNPLNFIDPLGLAKKNNKLPQSSYFDCDAADLEQCAKKCGSADNVERCAVRITPKIKCITSDGTQLTEDKVETLCECKGDDVNPIENEPNPVIIPIKPLPFLRLPVPVPVPIIP